MPKRPVVTRVVGQRARLVGALDVKLVRVDALEAPLREAEALRHRRCRPRSLPRGNRAFDGSRAIRKITEDSDPGQAGMEAAMGEHETDGGPMDVLRAHVQAIRTESARIGTEARRAAALDARERLAHRSEPLSDRIAALDSQVAAKLNKRGETPRPPREPQPAGDSSCDILWKLAATSFELADDATIFNDIDTYTELGYLFLGSALDCEGAD